MQQANSGHPGAPMALAPVMYCLWQNFLRYDPADPVWPNRDRFVLSNGHASMLLYATLYLAQVRGINPEYERLGDYAITLDDIKRFRQIDSRTPGHPEYRIAAGIETTTGPLGQGVGNSVGMAIAANWLAAHYNRPGFEIFNYNIYAMCGDGDMMEGVGAEAASLAGHLKLPNLCWIYDNNRVTLDGPADVSFTEDVAERFLGYGWNVTHVNDANDLNSFSDACINFLQTKDRPTLIIVNSHIGYGSPHKQDTNEAHGEPLGEEEVRLVKKFYGWPEDAKFLVPDGVLETFRDGIGKRGRKLRDDWKKLFDSYAQQFPELADQINGMQHRQLPDGWDKNLPTFPTDAKGVATRDSSGKVLNVLAQNVPWMVGGSADLATSDRTRLKFEGAGDFQPGSYGGRNLHFGVREHGMAAALNGMAVSKFDRTKYAAAAGVAKGAYILADAPDGKPQVILMSSGSEVQLCIAAYEQLKSEGVKARVVSMPSWAIFERQSKEYKQQVFPQEIKARVAVEQASTFGWSQYVGPHGKVIGMHTFGSSAPLKDVLKKFGFSPDKVVEAARATIAETK